MPTHEMIFSFMLETDDDVAVQEFVFRQLRQWAAESPVMRHVGGARDGQPVDRASIDDDTASSIEHCLHHVVGTSQQAIRDAIAANSGGTVRLISVGWSPPGGVIM